MSWFEHIGPLGIPLLLLSFIGLALILERILFFLRLPPISKSVHLQSLHSLLEKNKKCAKPVRDELVSYQLQAVRDTYYSGIRFLRLIAVISPMLGLLGTVIGIIDAFKVISLHDGPVYPALIADGLWTALLTTAIGLTIALPCLFAAFLFSRTAEIQIHAYQIQLNKASLELEGVIFND